VMDDFMAESLVLVHDFRGPGRRRFCMVFGHVLRLDGVVEGSRIAAGEPFATLAPPLRPGRGPGTHLHLSVGWLKTGTAPSAMDWSNILDGGIMILADPCHVLQLNLTPCQGNLKVNTM